MRSLQEEQIVVLGRLLQSVQHFKRSASAQLLVYRSALRSPVKVHRAHPHALLEFLGFAPIAASSRHPAEQLPPLGQVFSSPVFAPLGFGWELSPCSGLFIYTIYIAYIYQCLEGTQATAWLLSLVIPEAPRGR